MQKDRKKILMLIPNLGFGGAQQVFHDHGVALAKKYQVLECAFNLEENSVYPSKNKFISLGVPAGKNTLDKIYRFVQRCWNLHKLKNREEPGISISHLEGADYVNILSFSKEKKVLVIHGSKIHDEEMTRSYGWIRRKILLPFLYKRADLIITVSEGIRQELVHSFHLPAKKIVTIYNSFNIMKLKELASEPIGFSIRKKNSTAKLFTSGRLAVQKNQFPLLHVVKLLKDEYKVAAQLFFIGDGSLKASLKIEAEKLALSVSELNNTNDDLQEDILFLGYQQNPFKFYKEMDLFLFPSAWEGFPMALGEAMALGVPVLSADCPTGPLELLLPDWEKQTPILNYPKYCPNGVLLPIPKVEIPESIQMWSDAILHLIEDKTLRIKIAESAQKRMELLDHVLMDEKWLNVDRFLK